MTYDTYGKYNRLLKFIQQKYDHNFTTVCHTYHKTIVIKQVDKTFHWMDYSLFL